MIVCLKLIKNAHIANINHFWYLIFTYNVINVHVILPRTNMGEIYQTISHYLCWGHGIFDTKAEWMLENDFELNEYKSPVSAFQKLVTKIKYNANMVAIQFLKSSPRDRTS